MRVRWGLYGLLLWGAATLTAVLLHSQGIRREPIQISLADGTSIHGCLYRTDPLTLPSPPGEGEGRARGSKPAAVVLHGMAVTHQSCEAALALPLARCGFVVLAIDLRGHGRSEGTLPASWFRDLDSILEMRTDQPEVEAALQYLKALPDVDAERLCLLGHSLGGLVAANAACAREDIASVVAISIAPRMCDAQRPRNLFLYSGDFDRLIPPALCIPILRRATGGQLEEFNTPFGKLENGTGRQLWLAHWVSHMSPLFDPSASRHAVQWAAFSVGHDPGSVPGGRLIGADYAVLLAVLSGGVACTVFLRNVAERILPAKRAGSVSDGGGSVANASGLPAGTGMGVAWRRAACALALCLLAAPTAAFLGESLPSVGVLDAAAALTLFALLALVWTAAGWKGEGGGGRVEEVKGASVGMLCTLLGIAWLGIPFGATWVDVIPHARRVAVGLILLPLLLPWTLLLAGGIRRAVPARGRWFGTTRGLVWLAIPTAVWIGNELFNRRHPFFGISVTLMAAAFVVPLPLWLLEDRKGMTMARSVSLAASAAWIFACHLPFVSDG
ncbi:MAG: alpha/beta hydrolase [Gemmataceae bacterium]